MLRLFRPRKYRDQNKRNGFLEPYHEKEEETPISSPSMYFSREPWRLFYPHVLMWKN